MPYFKIEPSGCCVDLGLVRIRCSMFLEEGDIRYEERKQQIPIIPEGGYPGAKIEEPIVLNAISKVKRIRWGLPNGFVPKDEDKYKEWCDGLKKEWIVDTLFHDHFMRFQPEEATDENIIFCCELALQQAYEQWSKRESPRVINMSVDLSHVFISKDGSPLITSERMEACKSRINQIKTSNLGRDK